MCLGLCCVESVGYDDSICQWVFECPQSHIKATWITYFEGSGEYLFSSRDSRGMHRSIDHSFYLYGPSVVAALISNDSTLPLVS
jgi:hypothetical protein